jgi:hypothetical protein
MFHSHSRFLSRGHVDDGILALKTGLLLRKNMSQCQVRQLCYKRGKAICLNEHFNFSVKDYDVGVEELKTALRRFVKGFREPPPRDGKAVPSIMDKYISIDCAAMELYYEGVITERCIARDAYTGASCPGCNFRHYQKGDTIQFNIGRDARYIKVQDYYKRDDPNRLTAWIGRHELAPGDYQLYLDELSHHYPKYVWFYHYYQRWGCIHFQGVLKYDMDEYVIKECLQFFNDKRKFRKAPWIFPDSVMDERDALAKNLYGLAIRVANGLNVAEHQHSSDIWETAMLMYEEYGSSPMPSMAQILELMQRSYLVLRDELEPKVKKK